MPGDVSVEIIGARELLAAFRKLPKDASDQLREAAGDIAASLVDDIAGAARAEGRQAKLMAPTVKVKRDRVPAIQAGGSKRVGRNKVPAGELLYGSEFGSNLPQFRPHVAGGSYWFYSTIEARDSEIYARWLEAVDSIISTFEGSV